MDRDRKRSNDYTPSPIVLILVVLTMLGMGIYCIPFVIEELKTGKTYTLAVVFGDGNQVYKSSAPGAFWMNIGWQIIGFVLCFILPIGMLWENFIKKKKTATTRKH